MQNRAVAQAVIGMLKMPGAVGASGTETVLDFVVFTVTTMLAVEPVTA